MKAKLTRFILGLTAAAMPLLVAGCSSKSADSTSTRTTTTAASASQNGTVNMMMQDAPTEDWATIGVRVLSISLIPQSGGSAVTVYTAPGSAPYINLVELDQLSEILGNATVPAGTYSGAALTISGNPGDVMLTAAADPEAGFAGTPGAAIPANQIQIQGARGSAGGQTVSFNVNFVSPLVVAAGQSNALDLEFDLSHPSFIVAHIPPVGQGSILWAVNFNGPVRHHPINDMRRLVLRDLYGNVNSVSSDNTSITITKDYPVEPPTSPETAIASSQTLPILADSTNGTIFYDVDAKTHATIMNFSAEATSLAGKYVRVAARYQSNGSLVAVRIWASSSFNSVWFSPEGHVLHVNTSTDVVTVENETGAGVPLTVDANTQFFFRTPANALADSQPIATGTSFLTAHNLVRGFKVHVSVVDPLATPLVAQTIDIETAAYDGFISSPTMAGFTDTRNFNTSGDNYGVTLNYISTSTANGNDPLTGNPIAGFKWWNFAFPTLVTSGPSAIPNFIAATGGTVNFGGSVAALQPWGFSNAVWGDPANSTGWAANWTILSPIPVPLGAVATPWVTTSTGGDFTMTVTGGANAVTVNATSTAGSAVLVYQVDRTGGIVTVSPVDITTPAGLATIAASLTATTPVKVYGVPTPSGQIQAYVIFYYTGMKSMQ